MKLIKQHVTLQPVQPRHTGLSDRKTTILEQQYEIPGLDRLIKHKRKLRKVWQETRDPPCKTAI
jgi:hypothetical protein